MAYWEIFTLVTGLAYVVLEIRQKNLMWLLGILTALASMVVFFHQGLYAFFGLQVYYFIISFWGLYEWGRDRKALERSRQAMTDPDKVPLASGASAVSKTIHLNRLTWPTLLASAVTGISAFVGVALLMMKLDDPMPWLDSAVTVLGAVATWWLGKSYPEQWWLLIAANLLTVLMFALQDSWWMTALYAVYVAASVYGLGHWRKYGVYIEDSL